jgi:hypothetical protein
MTAQDEDSKIARQRRRKRYVRINGSALNIFDDTTRINVLFRFYFYIGYSLFFSGFIHFSRFIQVTCIPTAICN